MYASPITSPPGRSVPSFFVLKCGCKRSPAGPSASIIFLIPLDSLHTEEVSPAAPGTVYDAFPTTSPPSARKVPTQNSASSSVKSCATNSSTVAFSERISCMVIFSVLSVWYSFRIP